MVYAVVVLNYEYVWFGGCGEKMETSTAYEETMTTTKSSGISHSAVTVECHQSVESFIEKSYEIRQRCESSLVFMSGYINKDAWYM